MQEANLTATFMFVARYETFMCIPNHILIHYSMLLCKNSKKKFFSQVPNDAFI